MWYVVLGLSVCGGPGARTLGSIFSSDHRVPLDVDKIRASCAPAGLLLGDLPGALAHGTHVKLCDGVLALVSPQYARGVVETSSLAHVEPRVRASTESGSLLSALSSRLTTFDDLTTSTSSLFSLLLVVLAFFLSDTLCHCIGRLSADFVAPFDHGSCAHKLVCSKALFFFVTLASIDGSLGVCPHCKDSIPGCAGGNDCPLFKEHAANVAMFTGRVLGTAPRVTHQLPAELSMHFTRPICEAIIGLACAPAPGHEIDLENDAAYATSTAVVQAAAYGHCSRVEAGCCLARRLEDATTELAASKIQGAIDSLNNAMDGAVQSAQGVLSFVFAKCSNAVIKRSDGVHRLAVNGKGKPTVLSVSLTRPSTMEQFHEMLHFFVIAMVGLGLYSFWTVSHFVDDVVWGAARMCETWQVGFELLQLYLKEIDRDTTGKVTLANVFRRGGQDTLLTEARRNATMYFRTRAGVAQSGSDDDDDGVKPNGKFDKDSDKCCVDFNIGRPCKRLDANGTCLFNHKCNQFVSDKGPHGVCAGDHARQQCSYDAAKKLSKPSTH